MSAQQGLRKMTFPSGQTDHGEDQERQAIKIDKITLPREGDGALVEVFTMTLGQETIPLLPLKTWAQLDVHKWRARGLLPGTPAGLEIRWDHIKVAGETVSPWDSNASAKLEKAFNDWLSLEKQKLEAAKAKARSTAAAPSEASVEHESIARFQVEPGKTGQPRVKCLEGKTLVKEVALNLAGINALIQQGLMRKPENLKAGALHDWLELDGQVFRFANGTDGIRELEKVLNERYRMTGSPSSTQDVTVSANPASPTGFDIQFPATPSGLYENRKRHLDEETIQLLQDPEKCRVLRKGLTAKLAPPNLIFKLKTADGGEAYLEPGPETVVSTQSEDGDAKHIDLSEPVNLLNLGARELTSIFNHPAINRSARLAQVSQSQGTGAI